MFVRVWGDLGFVWFFAVCQSSVQYESSWQGLAMVWVFLLLVHPLELQPVGRVGGQEWCFHWSQTRGCDKQRKGHSCPAPQLRPGSGNWDTGEWGFHRTKRWADRPVNPQVCCTSFSPFQRFFQAKPKLVCTWCQAKGSQAQHPRSAWHCQGMWEQPQGQHSVRGWGRYLNRFRAQQSVSCWRSDNFTEL